MWMMLYQRNQISIITAAVFLGHVLQFSPVQMRPGVKAKHPGLCRPWESQEEGWYLQAAMASRGREPQEAGVGQGRSALSSLAGALGQKHPDGCGVFRHLRKGSCRNPSGRWISVLPN